MTKISEIAKKLSERITNAETCQRSRTAAEYQRLLYALDLQSNKYYIYI